MLKGILLLTTFVVLAFLVGKLVAKVQLPAILGWLITGMMIGPHALNFMNNEIMNAQWFHILINIAEVCVGVLIGSELILKDLKKSGKQIGTICIFEGMGAFILVSVVFFVVADIPVFVSAIFGAIALATAPAPSLSIVKEYNATGPVAKTLIPLAALDDVLAVLVFFIITGIISGAITGEGFSIVSVLMMIIVPFLIGAVTGFIGAKVLNKECSKKETIIKTIMLILVTTAIGIYINKNILSINLLLTGISFSAVIVNMVSEERAHDILSYIKPIIGVALVILIVNLGAPLDYKLILGAGKLTVIYIITRGIGKLVGTYIGGKVSKAEDNICKYLGFAMLPHSGVSLVFTGIAVGILAPVYPEYATMIQGTIAAAAVINEIIAVILAKQAFKMAGEISSENKEAKEVLA